ncbi:hypothetical protein B0A48_18047 [Cryoendolithus antarcticus]|uniref:Telomere replication protein EST3 n=1 Tax=Cryoendolithus antarcticus TaxID=1507870 RepID=A0A1V8SAH8_9PEZI|nr:hypothetical protein B0A48_18047 [Cryoendolithus antarcticus]
MIVRAYISKVGQCLVSDGQIQVRATLTSEAWSAYEAGLEAGQEPSQGDLICCQKLSVISTPFGPSDERIQLRIEQLEYVGKYRKTLGDPKPVNQRPKVQQLLEEITRIRAEQDDDHSVPLAGHAAAATNRTASGVAATGGDRPRISLTGADDQAARSQSHRSGSGSATGPAHPARSNLARSSQPLITNRESGSHFDTTLDQDSEDATSGNPLLNLLTKTTRLPTKPVQISASAGTASCQPASKRRKLSHDTALTPGTQNTFGTQAVNPRRRKPASLDHDGVGMADGVNNAGPIPPTSRRTDGGDVPQLPKAGSSHSSASPAHAEVDRMNVAIIDNAPTSAQIAPPDVVTSPRPRSRQQLTHPASNQPATARPDPTVESSSLGPRLTRLTRHKVPANQMALLEAKTCHVPPLPGQSLPHPNVPIAVLQAWNRHRQSSSGYAAPAQPGTTLQSVLPPSHSGPSSPTRTSEQEKEVHSSSSESDESEIIPWSQSPSQRALPLDSSAGAPVHRSQETPSQRPKLSIGSATVCGSQQPVTMRNGIFGVPGIQSPNRPAGRSGDNDSACTRIADKTHEASQIAMRPSPNKRSSTQVESGSTVTPPPAPKSGYGPEVRAGNASQATDKMQDADHGQVGSSQRNRQRQGGHQLDDDDRRELHTGQDPRNDHTRGGDSYRPSYVPPQPSADTSRIPHPLPSKPTTQTPNSSEGLPMEAPKPLDYREAHQERRRDFFRGEQRKQWLREKISPETSIVQILPWLAKYRKCYPQDPVTAGQFAAVVSQLCPRIGAREHGVLPETTADDTEPPTVSPPTAMPKQSQHQAEALGDALQDITPALPGQLTNGQALSIVSSTKSKSRGSSSQRSSRRSLPWATLPEGTTSTANEIVHTAQPERPSPARQDDTASLPVLEAGQDVVMTGTANAEVTVFTEFARAWHAIKPGGAFARASKTPVRLRAAGGKLDVLSWGFGK